jgi:tetratricopeptide (TPR) repeat protein
MRSWLLSALIAACLAFSAPAHADEQSELDKGRNAYRTRQYDEADARFRAMLDPKIGTLHDPALVAQAYMIWGAVMMAKGRPKEAGELFEQLLLKDPHFEPDPLSFPTAVLDAFSDTRSRIRQRLNALAQEQAKRDAERREREERDKQRQIERMRMLERLATEEKIIEHRSRLVAFVPFGAGQFQNGEKALGWVFLGAEALCLAAGTIAVPFAHAELAAHEDANDNAANPSPTTEAQQHLDAARAWRFVNLAAYGGFVLTAVAGIVQANVKFERDVVVVRKRPLPPTVSLSPQPTPSGLGLGLRLRF